MIVQTEAQGKKNNKIVNNSSKRSSTRHVKLYNKHCYHAERKPIVIDGRIKVLKLSNLDSSCTLNFFFNLEWNLTVFIILYNAHPF